LLKAWYRFEKRKNEKGGSPSTGSGQVARIQDSGGKNIRTAYPS
jgi:hypothetical protein